MNFTFRATSLVLVLIPLIALSQENTKQEHSARNPKLRDVTYAFIPVISYAPETQFGFGGGAQFLFRTPGSDSTTRLSNAMMVAMVTTKKQFIFDFIPQIYFRNERYFLEGNFKYKLFPNYFWGIGKETLNSQRESFDMRSLRFRSAWLTRIPKHFQFGIQYTIESHKMIRVATGGILDSDTIPGSTKSLLSGLGFVFRYDNRDNYFAPTRGFFAELQTSFTNEIFGSTHNYDEIIIDLRKYVVLFRKQVLALQLYSRLVFNDVPFQAFSKLGGPYRNRGYFEGRYMDNHIFSFQAEYRIPLHNRWSINAFIAGGEVSDALSQFGEVVKWSSGGGVRFKIKKGAPSTLRFDFGIGQNKSRGLYFGVNEVF